MTKIAEQFGVSGSYMARVCADLRVPKPPRGYWAKLAVGKAPKPTPLPKMQPGDQVIWSRHGTTSASPPLLEPVSDKPTKTKQLKISRKPHGLIAGARSQFLSGYSVEEGKHLKPYKKLLVHINSSISCLDKALSSASQIFNALESVGHRVRIAPQCENLRCARIEEHEKPKKDKDYDYYHRLWSPCRPTIVYIGNVAIGLALVELCEETLMRYVGGKYVREAEYKKSRSFNDYSIHTWTTQQDIPCGRLRLVAYCPYPSVAYEKCWQETKAASLKQQIPSIVDTIEKMAGEIIEKLKEAERQAEIRRLEWEAIEEKHRREEDQRRVQQSIKEAQEQLAQIIQAWGHAVSIEQFFKGIEDVASNLSPDERERVLERLALAREFIGTQNPLEFFKSWKTPLERYQPIDHPAKQE